ncbi:hypothetical protein PINS_up011145 [Pythium insidiosum]|nr:hypothetical protein PINS_up011145 [Pythium insidiosum]
MTESSVTKSRRFSAEGAGVWTKEEHDRFLRALAVYPKGPWKKVAELVGTRNARQTMTHAQKYRQKLARHERGLRARKRGEVTSMSPTHSSNGSSTDADETPSEVESVSSARPRRSRVASAIAAHHPEIMDAAETHLLLPAFFSSFDSPSLSLLDPAPSVFPPLEPLPLEPPIPAAAAVAAVVAAAPSSSSSSSTAELPEQDPRWMDDCLDLLVEAAV